MNARSEHEASYHHTAEFAERVRLNCSSLYLILQTVPFWRWPVRC